MLRSFALLGSFLLLIACEGPGYVKGSNTCVGSPNRGCLTVRVGLHKRPKASYMKLMTVAGQPVEQDGIDSSLGLERGEADVVVRPLRADTYILAIFKGKPSGKSQASPDGAACASRFRIDPEISKKLMVKWQMEGCSISGGSTLTS